MCSSSSYTSVPRSKLPCFSALPPLLFPEYEPLFEHQFHWCEASSVFPQLSQPVNYGLVNRCSSRILSGGSNSTFSLLIIFLSLHQVFPLLILLSPFNHSGVMKTSQKIRVCIHLIRGCHLIQIFQLFQCIISHSTILSNGVSF